MPRPKSATLTRRAARAALTAIGAGLLIGGIGAQAVPVALPTPEEPAWRAAIQPQYRAIQPAAMASVIGTGPEDVTIGARIGDPDAYPDPATDTALAADGGVIGDAITDSAG